MSANELPIAFINSGQVLAAGIVFPLVEIAIVSWRLYLRKTVATDDWLIVAALIFAIAMGITLVYGVAKGALGYPTPPFPDLGPMTELIYASQEQRLTELVCAAPTSICRR